MRWCGCCGGWDNRRNQRNFISAITAPDGLVCGLSWLAACRRIATMEGAEKQTVHRNSAGKTRWRWLLFLAICILLLAGYFLLRGLGDSGPVYQGVTLSRWLRTPHNR